MEAKHLLVPIALFVCATIGFLALLDAVIKLRLMHLGQSDASLRVMIESDLHQRRSSALRTGIALIALACGALFIQAFGWQDVTPGSVAAVVLPLGVGELIYYFLSSRNNVRS